jgi:hypothetical protein
MTALCAQQAFSRGGARVSNCAENRSFTGSGRRAPWADCGRRRKGFTRARATAGVSGRASATTSAKCRPASGMCAQVAASHRTRPPASSCMLKPRSAPYRRRSRQTANSWSSFPNQAKCRAGASPSPDLSVWALPARLDARGALVHRRGREGGVELERARGFEPPTPTLARLFPVFAIDRPSLRWQPKSPRIGLLCIAQVFRCLLWFVPHR